MNNTQRKMLDGIVQKRFKELRTRLRQQVELEYQQKEEAILNKLEEKYAKMLKAGREFYRLQEEFDRELRADGVDVSTNDKYPKLSFRSRYCSSPNKDLLKAESEKDDRLSQVDEEVEELRMVVWGSDLPFTDVKEGIESALQALETKYEAKA